MSHKFEQDKDVIIGSVTDRLKEKLGDKKYKLCAEFVSQFFGTISIDDLNDWGVDDLYGAALNFWSFVEKREPNETKIRIYNPTEKKDGWKTTHTVVEVICKDRPFLIDSLRIVINRLESSLHLVVHMGGICILRNAKGLITEIHDKNCELDSKAIIEAPIFIQIDRQTDPDVLKSLHEQFAMALQMNTAVVDDWPDMRSQVTDIIKELDYAPPTLDQNEVQETKEFLHWIEDHHFTLLGIRDYKLVHQNNNVVLQAVKDTSYGVLREELNPTRPLPIADMTPEARELMLSQQILVVSKTNTVSSVHRGTHTDYIGVKRFNSKGEVVGERRILGLYTSEAYNTNPKHIPFLRHKVAAIVKKSNLSLRSHAGRVLLNIIETLPRDDLIQGSDEDLLDISMGIFHMQERRNIRLFCRLDLYHRFISCLVYVPKDLFNTELRRTMQKIIQEKFNAIDINYSTYFSESVLARIHFMVRIDPKSKVDFNYKAIEKQLIEAGRSWSDDLQNLLFGAYGEEKANYLYSRYKYAFPTVYTASFPPKSALLDIKHIEELLEKNTLVINFYRPLNESTEDFRLKIYQRDTTLPLSDALPIIENLGLRAISERPYVIKFADDKVVWINDFSMHYGDGSLVNIDEIKELFQNAFSRVWFGDAENDGFNQLVIAAGLNSRQVVILRMYAKYFKQIGFTFSQEYIEQSLAKHTLISKKIVRLFEIRFDPEPLETRDATFDKLVCDIENDLEEVTNLDEDKIVRQYIAAIKATLRTNYYQIDAHGKHKNYISIKLNSKDIPGVPKPYPMYEIFVYSPKFEAVHLRCSKVARGGLRWSDRREDFRTEILGLMKAQQVKNAVIVPNGAKGGFVIKKVFGPNSKRDEILAEGISCYKQFMRGLLDITDNYEQSKLVNPPFVVCYDEDDPYLVVAADKGTATFSDIANAISVEYGFWMGDAFASGGSVGYDHKKMGITARGAWESVRRHFYERGIDINKTNFTVIGIGDMAGDVFGNGMLLSKHIQLVAAFNHMHVFVDPTPDPSSSFAERKRIFNLASSSWDDYDRQLISEGGGVFSRNAKSIPLSPQMQKLFNLKQSKIEPNAFIKIILQTKVDLLWSAGIGTFVKSTNETALDAGDRANDIIRVNGNELACRSVVEGGNLGLTQLGRVEYALNNGLIYTDFIDNSAGVSCSDKEVNTKILLNCAVLSSELTLKKRNSLLNEMTDEIASLVLRENYMQTRSINLSVFQALRSVELHIRLLDEFQASGKIDRKLEFLPNRKTLMDRKLEGKGLTSSEIAVLLCYCKTLLKESLLESSLPEDPYLKRVLVDYFPKPLRKKYVQHMEEHPLKREIIATRISNIILSEMSFSFIFRVQDETSSSVEDIARCYIIAREIMDMDSVWRQIDGLDHTVSAKDQTQIMIVYMRLLRRFVRWLLRSQDSNLDIEKTINKYRADVRELKKVLVECIDTDMKDRYHENFNSYVSLGIPEDTAHEITSAKLLFPALDIVEISQRSKVKISAAAKAYFQVGEFLNLSWIRNEIIIHTTENHWESLSRESLRDDFDWHQRQLTLNIISGKPSRKEFRVYLNEWSERNISKINRWNYILGNLKSSNVLTFTMFFVVIRELLVLTQNNVDVKEA
ncbi:MAG: NAD-glutamate dehydrogenase [Legionellaceae bacterium]|nr:NAD-glutamate dehydrogenase [Legionellaceae bacterium]